MREAHNQLRLLNACAVYYIFFSPPFNSTHDVIFQMTRPVEISTTENKGNSFVLLIYSLNFLFI